jgi:hypothetical protein
MTEITPIESGPPGKRREAAKSGDTLSVARIVSSVSFACGCVYQRVYVGEFEVSGYQLTTCYGHHNQRERITESAESVMGRVIG